MSGIELHPPVHTTHTVCLPIHYDDTKKPINFM